MSTWNVYKIFKSGQRAKSPMTSFEIEDDNNAETFFKLNVYQEFTPKQRRSKYTIIRADLPQEREEIKENKRYKQYSGYTVSEVASQIEKDFGKIDIIVHSLANGPEVKKPLLETSRNGYLAAISSSAYSFVSMVKYFGPLMNEGGSAINLTYLASERAVPGYGGGMSSAKAALESDTRTLAWEAGRKWNIRINSISAGALGSRAARAIGFIGAMIEYAHHNAPLQKDLKASEVGNAAAFLLSDLATAITGVTLYVDNGMHAMGVAVDSPALKPEEETSLV